MDYINRPRVEQLARVKTEINKAQMWIQRKHAFKMTERLVQVLYPASSLMVNVDEACEGSIRNLLSVQQLAQSTDRTGTMLNLESYAGLMKDRKQYQLSREPLDRDIWPNSAEPDHTEHVSRVHGYSVFQLGANIGLYPTPSVDVHLLVNLHIWLPELEDDEDTNFLLDYGYDVLHWRALSRLAVYFKDDSRLEPVGALFADAWEALMSWDAAVRPPYDGGVGSSYG
jgi:hypothetical protein